MKAMRKKGNYEGDERVMEKQTKELLNKIPEAIGKRKETFRL